MKDINTPASTVVPAVSFKCSDDFQKRKLTHQSDSAFAQYQRKSWIHPRSERRCNREALTTLLSAHGDNADERIEKLIAADISYRDLAGLTLTDLELIGFKDATEPIDLLNFFAELPNQDPSFATICSIKEAESYNQDILNNTVNHLENMRSAIAAANYKLRILPPEDFVVSEKHFASYFVLEALTELMRVTSHIDKELQDLQLISGEKRRHRISKANKFSIRYCTIYCTVAAAGTLVALWFFKLRKFV